MQLDNREKTSQAENENKVAEKAAEIVSEGINRFTRQLERFNQLREKVRERHAEGNRRRTT